MPWSTENSIFLNAEDALVHGELHPFVSEDALPSDPLHPLLFSRMVCWSGEQGGGERCGRAAFLYGRTRRLLRVLRVHCASGSVVNTPHAGSRTQCPSRSDYQRRYDLSRGGGRGSKCRRPLRTWGFPTAPNKKTQFKQEYVWQLISLSRFAP